jgi:RimJ/RimL family protein N-acetyltransferase
MFEKLRRWHNEHLLDDGTRIWLRPILTTDTPYLLDIFANLTSQSRYQRFIAAVDNVSPERVEEVATQMVEDSVTHGRGVLAMIDVDGEDVAIGGARYFSEEAGSESAEFAITIRDDYQRRGVGKLLLGELIRLAQRNGIKRLTGLALSDNAGLWRLVEQTGFPLNRHTDSSEVEFELLIGRSEDK